jgi:hypothetical protein
MYPELRQHVEHILPCRVPYVGVNVDCDSDNLGFTFDLHPALRS